MTPRASNSADGAIPAASPRGPSWMGPRALLLMVRNRFLTGLAFGVPLIVTIYLFVLVYKSMVLVGRPVIDFMVQAVNLAVKTFLDPAFVLAPPEYALSMVAAALPLVVFLGLGFMATNFIGKHLLAAVDRILLKFPLVSYVYSGMKQAIEAFKKFGQARDFKRVVWVDYPAPGCRLPGFVTSQYYDSKLNAPVTSVFIPTAPNPTTGLVVVVEDDKLSDCDMTLEEAMKMILSAGLVAPEGSPVENVKVSKRIGEKPPAGPVAPGVGGGAGKDSSDEEYAKWFD